MKNVIKGPKLLQSKLLPIIFISCLGIIIYSNTSHCSFHFDDLNYIVLNLYIRNIHSLLNNWEFYPCRFITFLSLVINYHFNGVAVFGYHLVNLAIHLICAILVWWLTLLTLSTPVIKKNSTSQHSQLIAFLTALVFVSHPVQTESVTYIWQRCTSLAALFYLASLCLYVKSRLSTSHQRVYYIGALIAAVLAMFTKENTVTLPLMILLYEISFFEDKKGLNWKYICPFLLTLLIIPLTIFLVKSPQFQKIQEANSISSWHYFLTQFRVIVTYIGLIFLPIHQNFDYDFPVSQSILEWPTLASFLFLAAILWLAVRLFSKYRLISFSIFWFFLALSLESSVLPLQNLIFEHRLYLPLVGYSLFLVSGIYYLFGKNSIKAMILVLTLIIGINSILTYQRNKVWRNEFTLWTDTIQKSPDNARPYFMLGMALAQQGDFMQAISNYDKAIAIHNKAIKMPTFNVANAYVGRGNIYRQQRHLPEALADYNKAIQVDSGDAETYYNLGILYAKQGDPSQALSNFNKAIEINPNLVEAYIKRGNIYGQKGDFTSALFGYNKALAIDPDNAEAYSSRALVYYLLKEYEKARLDVRQAQMLKGTVNPHFIRALENAQSNH